VPPMLARRRLADGGLVSGAAMLLLVVAIASVFLAPTSAEAVMPTDVQVVPGGPADEPTGGPSVSIGQGDGAAAPGDATPEQTPEVPTASAAPTNTPPSSTISSEPPSSPSSDGSTFSATPTSAPSEQPPTPTVSSTEASTSPTSSAVPASEPTQRPPTPPAVSTEAIPTGSVLIALAVLVLVSVLLLRLARRTPEAPADEAVTPVAGMEPATEVLMLMESAGNALVESGFVVTDVESDLQDIARAYGMSESDIIVMPTAVLVSARAGGQVRTGVVSAGRERLRLHQIEELDDVVTQARSGRINPREATAHIAAIRSLSPPFTPAMQLLGHVLATVGLAVLLGSSWIGLAVSAGLGALAGGLLFVGGRIPNRFKVLIIVITSFGVSLTMFLLLRTGLQFDVLPALIAPLVTLLPGALLTTAVIELSTGEMISGAGRLAAGATQLVLLGLGILGAAALAGVPALPLATPEPALGLLGPWLAVALFGVGIVMNQCARPRSLGWILIVLYVAYGAQVLGGLAFGGVLSAFVGAAAMTPVADLLARRHTGPPAIVSFTPAFWLLVPGALGLIGVAALLRGDTSGTSTLVTTAATMVAIAVGVVVGRAVSLMVTGRPKVSPRHAINAD
jgi:uncharacterized membrane protein YjjP (DUF1212 family)